MNLSMDQAHAIIEADTLVDRAANDFSSDATWNTWSELVAAAKAQVATLHERDIATSALRDMRPPPGRCPATSPGGSTNDGQLPRKGAQCGLPEGHDGEHSVLIPTGAPWSKWSGR